MNYCNNSYWTLLYDVTGYLHCYNTIELAVCKIEKHLSEIRINVKIILK